MCFHFCFFFGKEGKKKTIKWFFFLGWVKEIRVVGIRTLLICCNVEKK